MAREGGAVLLGEWGAGGREVGCGGGDTGGQGLELVPMVGGGNLGLQLGGVQTGCDQAFPTWVGPEPARPIIESETNWVSHGL